jgi:Amino acid permease
MAARITIVAILIGLGHSLLVMSGEESLAQVYREIASPKLQNLKRAALVTFLFSMLFTSLVSFFLVMIISDSERTKCVDNPISGMLLFSPVPSIPRFIGSNEVLNRVVEDGRTA